MDKKQYKDIDELLEWMSNDNLCSIHKDLSDIRTKSINYCKSMNFIQHKINKQYQLTSKGYDVINSGGLKKYLTNISDNKNLDIEIKIANLLKTYWWLIAASIGLGVAIAKYLV